MPENGIVLLVEDNQKILDLNRRMLEKDGCVVLTAKTLAEARERIKLAPPDVAVFDIMLPDGSGLDFLPEFRKTTNAPVLFLTAKAEREDVIAGLSKGANDYITKPYDIDEFRMRVLGFLRLVGSGANTKPKHGAAYLSDKLMAKLEQIPDYPLTTIIAPTGYGKTTAARLFARNAPPNSTIVHMSILNENTSDFWRDFSAMFGEFSESIAQSLAKLGIPSDNTTQREFLRLASAALKDAAGEVFLFIDDFHIISDSAPESFFLFVS